VCIENNLRPEGEHFFRYHLFKKNSKRGSLAFVLNLRTEIDQNGGQFIIGSLFFTFKVP
jgi:hypothetical protein